MTFGNRSSAGFDKSSATHKSVGPGFGPRPQEREEKLNSGVQRDRDRSFGHQQNQPASGLGTFQRVSRPQDVYRLETDQTFQRGSNEESGLAQEISFFKDFPKQSHSVDRSFGYDPRRQKENVSRPSDCYSEDRGQEESFRLDKSRVGHIRIPR